MNGSRNLLSRSIAALVCASLIITAPGLPCYAAAGQRASAPAGKVVTGVSATPALPASLNLRAAPALGQRLDSRVSATLGAPASAAAASATPSAAVGAASASTSRAAGLQAGASQVSNSGVVSNAAKISPSARGAIGTALAPIAGQTSSSADPSAIGGARSAAEAAVARPGEAGAILDKSFDGSIPARRAALSEAVPGGDGVRSSGLNAAQGASAQSDDNGGTPPPSAPTRNDSDGPRQPQRPSMWLVMALGAAGVVAAWFAAPVALAWLAGYWGVVAAYPVAAHWSFIGLGLLTGVGASQGQVWSGYLSKVGKGGVAAASGTFRLWARFGLVFHAAVTGGSVDDASKAPLPANILRYPWGAWLAVLIGYIAAPLGFAFGFLYKVVETPVLAAYSGFKQLVIQFFPWLAEFFSFLKHLLVNGLWFIGGLIIGAFRATALSVVAGASLLATPFGTSVLAANYQAKTLPAWIGIRVIQLLGLIGMVTAAIVGGTVALVFVAPIYGLTDALNLGFNWADRKRRRAPSRAFNAWEMALARQQDSVELLGKYEFDADEPIGVGMGLTRLGNVYLGSRWYMPVVMPFAGVTAYARAWFEALHFLKNGQWPEAEAQPAVSDEQKPEDAPQAASYLGAIKSGAQQAARATWRTWLALGRNTDAALRGVKQPSAGLSVLAYPAAAIGALAVAVAYPAGAVFQAVAIPGDAAWRWFLKVTAKLWPALLRFLQVLKRVFLRFLPFLGGVIVGSLSVFTNAWLGLIVFVQPIGEFLETGFARSKEDTWSMTGMVALSVIVAIPALALAAAGAAVGVIVGIPAMLTQSLGLGLRWAEVGGRTQKFFTIWSREAYFGQRKSISRMTEGLTEFEGSDALLWRGMTATGNAFTGIPMLASFGIAALVGYARSLAQAWRWSKDDASAAHAEEKIDEPARPQAAPEAQQPTEQKPWRGSPAWFAVSMGALGFAAGLFITAQWYLWPVFAVLGLGLSQPSMWSNWIPTAASYAKIGASGTWNYWSRFGDGFASAVLDRKVSDSPLAWAHKAIGGALSVVWGAAGAAFGLAAVPLSAAARAVDRIITELLPWLSSVWSVIKRVAMRFFPFIGGLIVGFVSGIVGSAAFGMLLLGRPYFKYVVSKKFDARSFPQWLGVALLKTVAFLFGVGFGLAGTVVGVAVALGLAVVLGAAFGPLGTAAGLALALLYPLTLSISMAFQFARIGGKTQLFFDLWSKGSLLSELRRLNQLTNSFEFPEPANGRLSSVNGWTRMINLSVVTFVAIFAAAIAGVVSYFRSLIVAWRDVRAGKTEPAGGFADTSVIAKSMDEFADKLALQLPKLGWVALIAGFFMWGFWKAVGVAFAVSVLGFPVGFILGGLIGLGVGLVRWLSKNSEQPKR